MLQIVPVVINWIVQGYDRVELPPFGFIEALAVHFDDWTLVRDIRIRIERGKIESQIPNWFAEKFFIPLKADASRFIEWELSFFTEKAQKVSIYLVREV